MRFGSGALRQIKIHRHGEQGVVTGAEVFARAIALGELKYAQTIPAYGHERRGAPIIARRPACVGPRQYPCRCRYLGRSLAWKLD